MVEGKEVYMEDVMDFHSGWEFQLVGHLSDVF